MANKKRNKAGRPKVFGDGASTLMMYVTKEQDRKLRVIAKRERLSLSALTREALELLFKARKTR